MRKGATGILYSAVQLLPSPTPAAAVEVVAAAGIKGGGGHLGDEGYRAAGDEERRTAKGVPGVGVVLKVEECAAPKRQMQNEWQVGQLAGRVGGLVGGWVGWFVRRPI